MTPPTPTTENSRRGALVVALCFLTIVADGYDLIVYGSTLPKIMEEPHWGLTHDTAGFIGSITLVGLMVGFVIAGPLADRIGRRRIIMFGAALFSLGSLVCAVAPNVEAFGAARFVTGIGLGGVVPSAVALTAEFAPANRRQLYNGLMLTGYSFGGIISALAAMLFLPHSSWRVLFGIAGAFVLIVPVMYFWLPESASYLATRRDRANSTQSGRDIDRSSRGRGYRELLTPKFLAPITMFVLIAFCVNLVVYGLNTWLPQIMRESGYALGSSISFLLVLQIGAVIGMVAGSWLADKYGSGVVMVPFLIIGAASLIVLSRPIDYAWLMIAVAGAGLGTIGTMTLTYGYVAAYFPVSCRGSAVGFAMGIGRAGAILGPMIGGWILSSSLGHEWSFYAFAIPALAAAGVVAVLARLRAGAGEPHSAIVPAA
ncbi:aromatic acid/H+ symport family MFS transporter [Gordonia sp. TBRC 11910]|uniref:Aromatic acid/H+ symport family MFS transporter n=1 Tax=Gordonia asplenii TaxID=2725283 RepID=A0A848L3B4_9ACTN|nr:aromatic acid/H+ symport family MFS transporter [Gordonia asplenii]NMO03093.1 aromatic acid/H+ symport family MFS transporter [Gordonia asplenii]